MRRADFVFGFPEAELLRDGVPRDGLTLIATGGPAIIAIA